MEAWNSFIPNIGKEEKEKAQSERNQSQEEQERSAADSVAGGYKSSAGMWTEKKVRNSILTA